MPVSDIDAAVDEVEWSRLFHAYGPALDTRAHLHDLAAGRDLSDAALHFESAIVHQSTLWSASPDALRLLLRVLRERDLPTGVVDRLLDSLVEAADNFDRIPEAPAEIEVEAAVRAWDEILRGARESEDDEENAVQLAYATLMDRPEESDLLFRYAITGVRRLTPEVHDLVATLEARASASPETLSAVRAAWSL